VDELKDTRPIRTVLADDHAIVGSGLRGELGGRFEIVGEADDAEGAIDAINARRPNLVVVGRTLDRGGVCRVRAIRRLGLRRRTDRRS